MSLHCIRESVPVRGRWLMPLISAVFCAGFLFGVVAARADSPGAGAGPARTAALERALAEAGTNWPALLQALNSVPEKEREGLVFLIEQMPPRDLRTLSGSYLLEN